MINKAILYLNSGLSVLPAFSSSKYVPYGFRWKKYQSELISCDYIKKLINSEFYETEEKTKKIKPNGLAIVTGAVSGNLEVIDFDNKFGDIENVFRIFCNTPEVKEIITGMTAETTQSGGYHLFYRCSRIDTSKKVALRLQDNTKPYHAATNKPIAIIETRGEGGLIISSPTKGYNLIGESDLTKIKEITPEERDVLFQHLNSFNEYVRPDQRHYHDTFNDNDDKPGNAYDADSSSIEEAKSLLNHNGWKTTNGIHYTRPGKKNGVSATFGKVAPGWFYVFTSNGHPFEDRKAYTPFQIFALLAHNGNFEDAAKELYERGYGVQKDDPELKAAYREIYLLNRQGVKQREAFGKIESEIPEDKLKELTKKIYEENSDEFGFDKKPAIEKAEIYLKKNYQFRRNVVSNIVEMKTSGDWEDLNVDTVYRDLQYNRIKFGMDNIKSLMKSDFVKQYDPFVEYFESLPEHTGENYFDQFTEFLNVSDKIFFSGMLRKHFVRAIKCAVEPDYYNRIVFTFLSANQEIGKSYLINWFNPFGSKYYSDEFLGTNKDSMFALAENFIYNLEELDTLSKMEVGKLKATISKRGVKDRPAYASQKIFMPRRCTFFGSTNREEFLIDDSNTRWLVFRVYEIDWKYIEMNIHDLWAEAYAYYKDPDFNCDLTPDEKSWRDRENQKYQVNEIERALIVKHFEDGSRTGQYMTNSDIIMKLGELTAGRVNLRTTPQKIGRIMSALGYASRQMQINGHNTRVYDVRVKRGVLANVPDGEQPF